MARYIAQVAFQPLDGLPKDQMENVWHFRTGGGLGTPTAPGDGPAISLALATFYTVASGDAVAPIDGYMSATLAEPVVVKVYDEDATVTPRPVFFQGSFTISGNSGQGLPEEIALCMSYYAGINRAKLRGRIYLGPFSAAAGGAGDTGNTPSASRPNANLINSIANAGEKLINGPDGSPTWCLRSAIGAGTKAAPVVTYNAVTQGWIDNEWDSQRRRRIEATARQGFGPGTAVDPILPAGI